MSEIGEIGEILGRCDPAFRAVEEAFRESFASRGEVGAAVSVVVEGRTVVDLWGGFKDRERTKPWDERTAVMVFSSTKGAAALCAHRLAAAGHLDLEQPVADLWPEFAANGKESIPVHMVLDHRAGLPAVREKLPDGAFFDWDFMCSKLAAEAPFWTPGEGHGYHALTYAWTVGEVVRRAGGCTLGRYFREEIAGPLGLEFWIGLPEAEEPRVARLLGAPLPDEPGPLFRAMADPTTLAHKAFLNPPTLMRMREANSRAVRAAEIPSANGVATARGLCGMYVPLAEGGSHRGVWILPHDAIAGMSAVASEGMDRVLLLPTRFSRGFMKTMVSPGSDTVRLGPNDEAFGHAGAGGSVGFADPAARVAFGYVMNQMGAGVLLNERGQSLVDAVYDSLG